MKQEITKLFSFVTGAVLNTELIYVIATDDAAKGPHEAHMFLTAWHRGKWVHAGGKPWPAVSTDIFRGPHAQFIAIGPLGEVVINTSVGVIDENIPGVSQRGTLRTLKVIDGEAYVGGMNRQVYRRKGPNEWLALDDRELRPKQGEVKGFEALDGFYSSELYGVGWDGEIWWFDGGQWHQANSSTDQILTSITCAEDGFVYVGGRAGMLLRGRKDTWEIMEQDNFGDDIWSLRWFKGRLYISGLRGVYELVGKKITSVDFGKDYPKSTYHLATCPDALVSIGSKDIMLFDGVKWQRIV